MIQFPVSVWNLFSTYVFVLSVHLFYFVNNLPAHNITFLDDNVTISILNHINEERIGIMYRNTAEVWGSCQIQKDIVEMLSCETSETLLDGFFEKYPLEHFELLQEIKKKIKYTLPETSRVVIKMSALMLEKNGSFEDMQKAVLKTGLKDKLNFKLDKCIISPEAFQSLFIDAGKQIVQYLKKELPTDLSDINSIILIGEFAQSPILQNIIMRSFPPINIQVPGEANMAAVKGSVLVGEDNIHVDTSVSYFIEYCFYIKLFCPFMILLIRFISHFLTLIIVTS